VVKNTNSHTFAESVILSACCEVVPVTFGEEYEKVILKIPMSGNIISQRVQDMSQDVESKVITNIKEADLFAIHLGKLTDNTGKVQLLAFSRFVFNEHLTEDFLFCKSLPETTKDQDILDVVNSYFSSHVLSWKLCISICTDGAHSMSGSLKVFVALAKRKNTRIFCTVFLA
jgi:hypothetical protein